MEYRVRSKRPDDWCVASKGKPITPDMVQLKLVNEARVLKPDGKLLCIYLPGAVRDLSETMWEDFSSIRIQTDFRKYAGGKREGYGQRHGGQRIHSGILGSIAAGRGNTPGWIDDGEGGKRRLCRLTAFTATEVEKWDRLMPMFQRIAQLFETQVPDRFAAQMKEVERTHDDWVIDGTPFTTITVNNTYPTNIHTDKGDLDAGFSNVAVLRRGSYKGGWLTFPQYGVAADLQDGDLLLMDAHEWHGNTPLLCAACDEPLMGPGHRCADTGEMTPERVSIVSYFRTSMVLCGSLPEERAGWEKSMMNTIGVEEEHADKH